VDSAENTTSDASTTKKNDGEDDEGDTASAENQACAWIVSMEVNGDGEGYGALHFENHFSGHMAGRTKPEQEHNFAWRAAETQFSSLEDAAAAAELCDRILDCNDDDGSKHRTVHVWCETDDERRGRMRLMSDVRRTRRAAAAAAADDDDTGDANYPFMHSDDDGDLP